MRNGLWRFQETIRGAILNFPIPLIRPALYILTFPFGAHRTPASDKLGHIVARMILKPSETLDRLTRYIYISDDPNDITGRLEVAFKKSVETKDALKKLDMAIRAGKVKRLYGTDWIAEAERQGILTKQEAADVRESEELTERAIAVDHFDPKEIAIK